MQTVRASEIKRRGLAAVEDLLDHGPVHVIKNNRLACVVLSEAEYARLRTRGGGQADVWALLLAEPGEEDWRRSREALDAALAAERESWEPD